MPSTRAAAVAGYFYPAAPAQLAAMVQTMLQDADGSPPVHQPKALIVPHAGYD